MSEQVILDLLLNLDEEKIKNRPSKKVKIARLSEVSGSEVIFTCQAVSAERMKNIEENAIKYNTSGQPDIDVNEVQLFTVLEGVKDPDLKNKELREKFGALNPKELVMKLLLPGEITRLYNVISELSGYGDNAVEEVKN